MERSSTDGELKGWCFSKVVDEIVLFLCSKNQNDLLTQCAKVFFIYNVEAGLDQESKK